MGNTSLLAGEQIGLFARSGSLTLNASEGPVQIQAQNGEIYLSAEQKLSLIWASDMLFAGKKRVTLIGDDSYLKIEAGKIDSVVVDSPVFSWCCTASQSNLQQG